ncbi:glycosyltransferase family 2 protein [Phyllobacterium sp. 0TCS1.6C]|uniref:glycosyltransferase family 2 protein n=1 Tax=unclassified Phyllobacterium TaxID=2638441 RepID=UPI002263FA44|nr:MULTISPECIES: glycosyltransferase family 2 protein [unclassified Phyllobacterium]MCX8281712.1 glycosyltransferase family 2 protein [Phyllobacterium sp. 0TCS1.6C]MCX8294822.1 glycosyltransferase family 2 protein [Phyllobacterium sp. 0TCS1.6A]
MMTNQIATAPRCVCIATVTRDRPVMLECLLRSYSALAVPPGIELRFAIVENNPRANLHDIVERFRLSVPERAVHYEIEPRLGIAFARNRALDAALHADCHILLFADDDEVVDTHWLEHLLAARDRDDLDIVGGPVRLLPLEPAAGTWHRLVWNGIDRRNRAKEHGASRLWKQGRAARIVLATGSWLGNLEFFRGTALRFDETLGFAGGEDSQLWKEAVRRGARTGWAPAAIAAETMPLARLTLRYQFCRSRDTCAVALRKKLALRPWKTALRLPGSMIARLFKFLACLLLLPFRGGAQLVAASICLGSLAGLLHGLTGRDIAHYRTTTGA